MAQVVVRKRDIASKGHGRGSDNVKTPATYEVVKDDKVVGYIIGSSTKYMESTNWDVINKNYRLVKTFWGSADKPFTKAKAFALKHFR